MADFKLPLFATAGRTLVVLSFAATVSIGAESSTALGETVAGSIAETLFESGRRLENGEGVAQDYVQALEAYCNAAYRGHADAAYSIGWMYLNGRGLERSDDRAAAWFRQAAARGHRHAEKLLRHLPSADLGAAAECGHGFDRSAAAPQLVSALEKMPGSKQFGELVADLAPRYGLEPEFVLSVIAVESAFDHLAVSSRNAQGLMQLIPATAERFGVSDPFDPAQNLKGGIRYLQGLLAYFEGNVPLTLAAYNAGEGAVDRYRGIPPFPETKAYVEKVTSLYPSLWHPYRNSVAEASPIVAQLLVPGAGYQASD